MTSVVDASVLVAATVDTGPDGLWAEAVISNGPIYAPELVYVEATNTLRRLERAKRITPLEAAAAHDDHMQLAIESLPFAPFADRIWALRHTLTSCDAWYVAVAEVLGLPLATLDRPLAKASGPECEFLLPPERTK